MKKSRFSEALMITILKKVEGEQRVKKLAVNTACLMVLNYS